MRKFVKFAKRVVAMTLIVAMMVSLFRSDMLRTFADVEETSTTPVLDFVPEGVEPVIADFESPYPIVYVKNNEVTLYEEYRAGAPGAVYTGAQGEQIQLAKSYTYTVGEENVVLYQYTYQDFEGVMYTAYQNYYMFISADDISFEIVEKPEVTLPPTTEPTTSPEPTATPTPSPEPTPTSTPTPEATPIPTAEPTATPEATPSGIVLDTVPQGEIPVSKTPEAKYGTIKTEAIKLFESPEYGADGVEMNVNVGTMIELVTAYTFESNGQVVYRFDYNSAANSELFDAALSQYSGSPFIPAEYVNVGIGELVEKTVTDVETGMSVTALVPATAELISEQKAVSALPENADTTGINDNALFYDLTLANGGAVYQSTSALKVIFPQENISIPVGAEYIAYHVSDAGVVDVIGENIYTGGAIDVTVDSLSYVGLSSVVIYATLPYTEATFKNDTVTLYQNFTDESSTVEISITDKGKLVLEAAYDVDGTLMYVIYSYEGTDTDLDKYINGNENTHRIVKATDVEEYTTPTPTPTPTPVPTPDTTPVIPENPTLTEGVDVSIVDAEGAPVTDAGLKVREGTKISLSAWTGLTDVGDETYQWQISSEETAGYWVNINGQQSKGLLMSLAMVNSMTVPSIRCKIITGGVTKYSMAIPVTALKENAFTDNSSNVSVAGVLPIDATLMVSNKSLDDTGLNNGVYPMGEASLFNDVTLYRGGSTYQPEDGETVTVTFPESSVTSTGFAAGDAYHVYHIHDGVVDLSEIKYYDGGNVDMTFSNLSVVGISEATPAEKDLVEQHGAIISEETLSPYLTMYVKNDSVVLYDTPESSESVHITTVTGRAGAEVEAWQKITYTDGFVVYRVASTANTPTDLSSTLGAYPIISALDLSEEYTDEPIIINTCAICGKELGTECVTPHVYCPECKEFDCGKTHEKPVTEKPITVPVIPTNPTLTEGAEVSIVDAEGDAITAETGFVIPEGTRASLSVWSDLEDNSDVTYQWQIRYDAENDLWTDIQGKDEKGLVISPAMVNSITSPAIRCEMTSGEIVQYSDTIPVTVNTTATLALDEVSSPAMFNVARMSSGIATMAELGEYTVVINYVFGNNVIVADPYTATLAAGSNFSATVNHPVIQGYLPYVGTETETSTKIDLNITNIQSDVTYTVTYKPTNVDYTVIYYQQNIDNDNYTEAERETMQGLTGDKVTAVGKNKYPGFYELLYEQPVIAADGSTIVEVYYDRVYYLVLFNLGDGGYGVEPIYDRYGATIGDVGTPTRSGYTFMGWDIDDDGKADKLPETMPVGGGRYDALWTANDTAKVKVVFWGENADDNGYSYIKTTELTLQTGSTYTFGGGTLTCTREEHEHTNDCYNWICTREEHEHSGECLDCVHVCNTSCYVTSNGRDLLPTNQPTSLNDYTDLGNGIYRRSSYFNSIYYVKIGDQWYCGRNWNGNAQNTTEITYNCTHIHSDENGCYDCGKTAHIHDSSCRTLICTMEKHKHSPSCYTGRDTSGDLDSKYYTFRKSDTVTVSPDGLTVVNVYFDRTEFTLTFRDGDTTVYTITEKWGSNISSHWPIKGTNGTTYDDGERWDPSDSSIYTEVLVYLDIMPAESFRLSVSRVNYDTFIMHYMVETLPGETGTNYANGNTTKTFKQSFQVSANYNYVTKAEDFFDLVGFEQWASNPKFGSNGQLDINGGGDVYFYYERHNYAIEFHSPTSLLRKTENVPFESPLSSYNWTPDASMAPSQYEPGSVKFEGWYLNPECTGEKFDFTTHTMPAGTNDGDTTLTLYAKWVPVTRTVTFYLDKETMDNKGEPLGTRTTPHGSLIERVDEPDNGDYTFVSWFYIDEDGKERAFVFDTMAVTKDMNVYAKWSSNVLKEYIVYFKIQGTDTQIAAPITGSTLAGETRTFDAKGGTELDLAYQEGYFPLVESHSMTLDINTPETPGTDENGTEWVEITDKDGNKKIVQSFTFWYVQKDAVPYTVYYVAETLKNSEDAEDYEIITRDGKTYYIIFDNKDVSENRKAVVTETFVPVSGYIPDAYQKRLVVDGTDGAVNEIIFYYSVDSTHAYYKITHYTQNTDGENWTEYASSQAIGDIGKTYIASPLNIDGFTYDSSVDGTVVSGKLTEDGLELKLYYVRNSYPYKVRYLEKGSGVELAEHKTGTGLYGKVVSESAIEIANYVAVDPTSQTLTIKIEESQDEAKLNIITFYYEEKTVTINYKVVGPDGCGTVNVATDDKDPGRIAEETLKVLTGEAQGSTAEVNENYRFIGWYSDEKCTKLLSADTEYVPKKEDTAWVDGTTYYAKFELDVADLIIEKVAGDGTVFDENDTFVFKVKELTGKFETEVVIVGEGSITIKDLPIGTYEVSEDTSWSYKYNLTHINGIVVDGTTSTEVTLTASGGEVTFTNTAKTDKWLKSDAYVENIFKDSTGQGSNVNKSTGTN